MTKPVTREEFDAEMAEWNRKSNERWSATNRDLDRHDATLARIRDQQTRVEEILERQGLSLELLLEERGKANG
jgi:hypothetical protein